MFFEIFTSDLVENFNEKSKTSQSHRIYLIDLFKPIFIKLEKKNYDYNDRKFNTPKKNKKTKIVQICENCDKKNSCIEFDVNNNKDKDKKIIYCLDCATNYIKKDFPNIKFNNLNPFKQEICVYIIVLLR